MRGDAGWCGWMNDGEEGEARRRGGGGKYKYEWGGWGYEVMRGDA